MDLDPDKTYDLSEFVEGDGEKNDQVTSKDGTKMAVVKGI
jgi:hypothetical protein